MNTKRANGRYYTLGNPFSLDPFREWVKKAGLPNRNILEPFAGANYIIKSLQSLSLCNRFRSYDISPADRRVQCRDTIDSFPQGYSVCVTNPPWLAKNSASRRALPYPATFHDDLYKHCLELCLKNCAYVAAIIPASYLQSELFRGRLSSYILLHDEGMFNDTSNPVCLALFEEQETSDVGIYYDNEFIGRLQDLENKIPKPVKCKSVRFNDPNGNLGFISFDNTKEPSIKFCEINEIREYPVKVSSRFFSRIRISAESDSIPSRVKMLNKRIDQFRVETKDIFLTPFKGLRKDGYYRRRMDFTLARKFIDAYD